MRVANGACNLTTAVALEQNLFRELLGISGVAEGCNGSYANGVMWAIAQDAYHAQKYNNYYNIPFVLYDVHVVHMCTPSRVHEGL